VFPGELFVGSGDWGCAGDVRSRCTGNPEERDGREEESRRHGPCELTAPGRTSRHVQQAAELAKVFVVRRGADLCRLGFEVGNVLGRSGFEYCVQSGGSEKHAEVEDEATSPDEPR
jgi:hypothetical protein